MLTVMMKREQCMLDKSQAPHRDIHHADALEWLRAQNQLRGCSIITSLPDISEFPKMKLAEWQSWFVSAITLIFSRADDNGLIIFYQSDIKREGVWVDKGYLCLKAAEQTGHALISHKIICRAPAGTPTFGRPGYSHLLCFSKNVRPELTRSYADVLPDAGETTWTRGMGEKAGRLACKMVMSYTKTTTIVDPFCGHGLVLAIANELGLNAVGVDHSLKCVKKARAAQISPRA